MPVYVFCCPCCKKQFKLTINDASSLIAKVFTCPACKYSAPFPSVIKELSLQPVTHSDNSYGKLPHLPNMQNKTKVAQAAGASSTASVSVIGTEIKFILKPGGYVLGRRSSDSTATLQLAPDIAMSRQHAKLVVAQVGGTLKAQIVGLKSNNPIFVNGKLLPAGQPYIIKASDVLQLGSTKIVVTI